MRTEQEIKDKLAGIESSNWQLLDRGPATIDVNMPVALMQIELLSQLDLLYWVMGQKRPTFKVDDRTKENC